jgi:uncharacterized protein (TIGR02646 family)
MIHTPRPSAPARLARKQQAWTARYLTIFAGDSGKDWATPVAKRLIREALLSMTRGKCIYCESILELTSRAHVEHYHAKTLRPEIAFDWTNLLPACEICNDSKGVTDHSGRLLKPDAEDPEPFFWIDVDSGKLEPHPSLNADSRERAEATIRLCNLQRGALCTLRIDMIKRVSRWVTSEVLDPDEWNDLARPSTPYKFVIRHVLKQKGLGKLADEDRRLFTQ